MEDFKSIRMDSRVEHDFTEEHVLQSEGGLRVFNRVKTFKGFIEVGISCLKVFLFTMENAWVKGCEWEGVGGEGWEGYGRVWERKVWEGKGRVVAMRERWEGGR